MRNADSTYETHRTREVGNQVWDMQILYIKGQGYQATYYRGADPMMWSKCCMSADLAGYQLDQIVDKHFGAGDFHYVKVGCGIPKPIKGISEAIVFASMWNGILLTPIVNP